MPRFSSWIAWLFLGAATAQPSFAAPTVVTDISTTHSLVSMVMDGVQEPKLLIDALNNPHGFALRPSDANALANADIIFYTSLQLTPWMHRISESIAAKVPSVELLNIDGTIVLPIREGDTFESHNHQDESEQSNKDEGNRNEELEDKLYRCNCQDERSDGRCCQEDDHN